MSVFRDDETLTKEQIEADDGLANSRVLDAVALTIISACVGIRASEFPDNAETAFSIIMLMMMLFLFHLSMGSIYRLIYYRQFKRAPIVLAMYLPAMVLITAWVGHMVGNYSLGIGLMAGWLFTFLWWVIWVGGFKTAKSGIEK